MSAEDPAIPRPPPAERVTSAFLWGLVAYIAYLGLNVAVASKGVVPDYDALAYLNAAMRVHLGLSGGGLENFSQMHKVGVPMWVGLPFTNTLDVLLVALTYKLVDYHVAIWAIHSAYVVLFVHLARRLLGTPSALLLLVWAVSTTYFMHQYTSFISEMKVGMFLCLFIAYLFHDEVSRHLRALCLIVVLLILLRIINLLFIAPLLVVYAVYRWRDPARRGEVVRVMKVVGAAILLLSPLIVFELRHMVPYILAIGRHTSENWQDMTGIYSKKDLFNSYATGVWEYNRQFVAGALAVIAAAVLVAMTRRRARLAEAARFLVAFVVVALVLMQANTNNIMVVYWVYILVGLVALGALRAFANRYVMAAIAIALVPVAVWMNYEKFRSTNQALAHRLPIAQLADGIKRAVEPIAKPVMCFNFGGVGPLEPQGLEITLGRTVSFHVLNAISYVTPLEEYVKGLQGCNIAVIANRNFMWPDFLGVNRQTEAIARYVTENAAKIGFVRAARENFDQDTTRYVDIYVRPSIDVKLKYARFNDFWLDAETTVVLRAPGQSTNALDGYRADIDVMVPGVNDPQYAPPLTATLYDAKGQTVRTTQIRQTGNSRISFPLDGLAPGSYRLSFDKGFSTREDPRRLSALFSGAVLAYTR
jgi:hypothetical protein